MTKLPLKKGILVNWQMVLPFLYICEKKKKKKEREKQERRKKRETGMGERRKKQILPLLPQHAYSLSPFACIIFFSNLSTEVTENQGELGLFNFRFWFGWSTNILFLFDWVLLFLLLIMKLLVMLLMLLIWLMFFIWFCDFAYWGIRTCTRMENGSMAEA